MKLRLLFIPGERNEMATLVAAVDEYTEDIWGRTPDFYADECVKHPNAREAVVVLSDEDVLRLFEPPTLNTQL